MARDSTPRALRTRRLLGLATASLAALISVAVVAAAAAVPATSATTMWQDGAINVDATAVVIRSEIVLGRPNLNSTASHRYGALGRAWPAELEAQLARFRGDDRQCELFETAVAGWQAVGHDYDATVCRLRLAEAHAGHGERALARTLAQQALTTAQGLGAASLERQAEGLVARLGSTERAAGLLTWRELEVLALIVQGRSNEQIGAALFMSPKTASVHVSRIITKLGAAYRTEAAAIA